MRKLLGLAVAGLLAVGVAGSSQAGTFDPTISTLKFGIAGLGPLTLNGFSTGTATLATDGSTLSASGELWTTVNFAPGTALFTGVPNISNLTFTINAVAPATYTAGFSRVNPIGGKHLGTSAASIVGLGGAQTGSGSVAIELLNGAIPSLVVPASGVGADLVANTTMGGKTVSTSAPVIGKIIATGVPFHTGMLNVSGLNTNIITILTGRRAGLTGVAFTLLVTQNEKDTQLTAMVGTGTVTLTTKNVTVTGSKNTTSGTGTITLVAPLRVTTQIASTGIIPNLMQQTYRFVPEPGSLLLIGSGIVGLLIVGRKRMKS